MKLPGKNKSKGKNSKSRRKSKGKKSRKGKKKKKKSSDAGAAAVTTGASSDKGKQSHGKRRKSKGGNDSDNSGENFEYSYYSNEPVYTALKGKVVTVTEYTTMKDKWAKESKKAQEEKKKVANSDQHAFKHRTKPESDSTKKGDSSVAVDPDYHSDPDRPKNARDFEWHPGTQKSTIQCVIPRPGTVGKQYNGKVTGLGTSVDLQKGTLYVGELRHSKKHGYGHSVFVDGSTHTGGYKEGKKHGHGVEVNRDGTTFMGLFRKNARHGLGTIKNADGTEWTGFFVKGVATTDPESDISWSSTSSLSGRAPGGQTFDEGGRASSDFEEQYPDPAEGGFGDEGGYPGPYSDELE